jgi:hypothetical protein
MSREEMVLEEKKPGEVLIRSLLLDTANTRLAVEQVLSGAEGEIAQVDDDLGNPLSSLVNRIGQYSFHFVCFSLLLSHFVAFVNI